MNMYFRYCCVALFSHNSLRGENVTAAADFEVDDQLPGHPWEIHILPCLSHCIFSPYSEFDKDIVLSQSK